MFNDQMGKPVLALIIAGISIFGVTLYGQTTQASGKVLAVSSTTITIQSGNDVWDIKRTETTKVNGTLKPGSSVTVTYNTPDGQKREGPVTSTNPTPTPAGQ